MFSAGKPDSAKLIAALFAELVKHQAKKQLGDGSLTAIAALVSQYAGESTAEKLSEFLNQGANAQQLLGAFHAADACFSETCGDSDLKGAIASKPLRSLPELENLARALPSTLSV